MENTSQQYTTGSYVLSHKDTKDTKKAFIEITTDKATGFFIRALGYLEHLEACKRAVRVAPPVLNLHPLVKENDS